VFGHFENHAYPRLSTAIHGYPRHNLFMVLGGPRQKSEANRTYPNLMEPFRTVKYSWGAGKKLNPGKPNQAY
jgi:hypothetical protein